MKIAEDPELTKANQFLSGIKDPLELDKIVSMVSESGVDITSAHIELLCRWTDNKNLICADPDENNANRISLALLIKKNLDVIPVGDNPKFLSSYYRFCCGLYRTNL